MRMAFMNNTNQRWIDAETKNRPTTVEERYPHHLDRIFKLCYVETEEDLPVIWQQMANRKRDGEPLATLMHTQARLKAAYFGKKPPTISVPHELSLKQF